MKLKTKKKMFARIQKHMEIYEYGYGDQLKGKLRKPIQKYVKGKQLRRLLSNNIFWLMNDDIRWKMPDGSTIKTHGWMYDRHHKDAINNYATGRVLKRIKDDAKYIILASNTGVNDEYDLCIVRVW